MTSSRNRDRAKFYFVPEYGATKSPLSSFSRLALLMIGVFGLTSGACGFAGHPIIPKVLSNPSVFAAAPTNLSWTGGTTVESVRLYAPPPYTNVTPLYTLLLERNPSRGTSALRNVLCDDPELPSGGTRGTAACQTSPMSGIWAKAKPDCRTVEMWFPNKDMQSAPTTNDPNASVTVRITPPSSGKAGNCTVWKKHYGVRPKSGKARIVQPKT